MAGKSIKVRLVSTASPFFYTTMKNPKGKKLSLKKYDPNTKKHELFEEKKIK